MDHFETGEINRSLCPNQQKNNISLNVLWIFIPLTAVDNVSNVGGVKCRWCWVTQNKSPSKSSANSNYANNKIRTDIFQLLENSEEK